jgi:hypothetical protein
MITTTTTTRMNEWMMWTMMMVTMTKATATFNSMHHNWNSKAWHFHRNNSKSKTFDPVCFPLCERAVVFSANMLSCSPFPGICAQCSITHVTTPSLTELTSTAHNPPFHNHKNHLTPPCYRAITIPIILFPLPHHPLPSPAHPLHFMIRSNIW